MPTPLELAEERPRGPCVGSPLLVACPACGLLARLDLDLIAAHEPARCPRGHPIAVGDVPGVREVAAWVVAVVGVIDSHQRTRKPADGA